jgi:glycosyltransferase involved in cell wall biosynthesis
LVRLPLLSVPLLFHSMRLVFDSSPFRYISASGRGPSGVAKWSLGALSALSRQKPEWELIGVAPGFDSPTLEAAEVGENVSYRRVPMPRRVHHVIELMGLDPNVDPWTGRVDAALGNAFIPPKSRRSASLPVIYDLSVVKHPEMHPKQRIAYVAGQLSRVMSRATVVVTISESVRQEIAEHYKIPLKRIVLAPPSWQPAVFPYETGSASRIDLPGEYFLFVGTVEPRKNILGLLTAIEALRARRPDAPPLLLVGGEGWGSAVYGERLKSAIASGAVLRPGYVPDDQMAELYKGALGLVYPSLYEGFGMPIIEAMAAGCPVITSDVSATAEAAQDAAMLVNPTDYEQLEHAMERLMDDAVLRDSLIKSGLARSRDFTWEKTAAKLEEAIELAVSIKGRR